MSDRLGRMAAGVLADRYGVPVVPGGDRWIEDEPMFAAARELGLPGIDDTVPKTFRELVDDRVRLLRASDCGARAEQELAARQQEAKPPPSRLSLAPVLPAFSGSRSSPSVRFPRGPGRTEREP